MGYMKESRSRSRVETEGGLRFPFVNCTRAMAALQICNFTFTFAVPTLS